VNHFRTARDFNVDSNKPRLEQREDFTILMNQQGESGIVFPERDL
jgi:hypothetical protein